MKVTILIAFICFSSFYIQPTSSSFFGDFMTGFINGARSTPLTTPNTCELLFPSLSTSFDNWMTALETPLNLGNVIYKMQDYSSILAQTANTCGFQAYYNQLINVVVNNPSVVSAKFIVNLKTIQTDLNNFKNSWNNGSYLEAGKIAGQIIYLMTGCRLP